VIRRRELPWDDRVRLRVRPGQYFVSTSWGVHSKVELRDGETVRVDLDANYCKQEASDLRQRVPSGVHGTRMLRRPLVTAFPPHQSA